MSQEKDGVEPRVSPLYSDSEILAWRTLTVHSRNLWSTEDILSDFLSSLSKVLSESKGEMLEASQIASFSKFYWLKLKR